MDGVDGMDGEDKGSKGMVVSLSLSRSVDLLMAARRESAVIDGMLRIVLWMVSKTTLESLSE